MAWYLIALPLLAAVLAFFTRSVTLRVRLLPATAALHLVGELEKIAASAFDPTRMQ